MQKERRRQDAPVLPSGWKALLVGLVACVGVSSLTACKKRKKADSAARIAKFLKCVDVVNKSARPDERSTILARCVADAKLFGRAKCNAAWKATLAATPDEKWRLIAVGCGRQYCPILKAPKPTLCDRLSRLGQTSIAPRQWHAFHRAVLRAEAGSAVSDADLRSVLRALAGVLLMRVPVGKTSP